MDLTTLLSAVLTPDNIDWLASKAGIENKQAQALIKAWLPVLLGGLKKNTETTEWAQSLSDALEEHQELPTNLWDLLWGDKGVDAQKILGHILGGDTWATTDTLAKQAWVSSDVASGILWALAQAALGGLGQAKKQWEVSTGTLGQTLGSVSDQLKDGSMVDTLLLSFLDKNKDGSYKDDLITMAVNWVKGQLSSKK